MTITTRYNYSVLTRIDSPTGRKYETPGGPVPSVTTILDATKSYHSKITLENWRKRVGHQNAQLITQEAASRGTRMHSFLEEYINTGILPSPGTNPYSKQSHTMAQQIIDKGLVNASEYWGTEITLHYPEIYAGSTDCVGMYNNQPSIIDFKQTNKPKKTEWITDYFVQLVAYALSHNCIYSTNIRQGVILMCSKDNEFQTWTLSGTDFDKYETIWWDRVEQYYRNA